MMNRTQDLRANDRDVAIGRLKYVAYLFTEPLVHLMDSYPNYDSPVYGLNMTPFINQTVEKRMARERAAVIALEQAVKNG